jgi:UDP-glucuronate decarboxylase
LGNPDEYTILQLAQTVQTMINPGVDLIYKPLPQDDPQRRKPDISRAQNFLQWSPSIPLQEGLALTIDDFRLRLDQGMGEQLTESLVPAAVSSRS